MGFEPKEIHSRRRDLNPRPADYESAAIPLSHDGKRTGKISRLKIAIKNLIILFVQSCLLLRFRRIKFNCSSPYLMEWQRWMKTSTTWI